MLPYISGKKGKIYLEIGGGSGNLASVLQYEFSPKVFFMVDLPESLVNSFIFLSSIYTDSRFILPDMLEHIETEKLLSQCLSYDKNTFVFLTPWQCEKLPSNFIDLSVNTHSFQEMRYEQISSYFDLVERVSKKGALFFCMNRVEKIPGSSDANSMSQEIPANFFYEYPWRKKNERLIDEISRLHHACTANAHAIRLERIS